MNRSVLFLVLFVTLVAVVAIPQYNPKPIQLSSEGATQGIAQQATEEEDKPEGEHVTAPGDAEKQDSELSKGSEGNTLTSEYDEQKPETQKDEPAPHRSKRQLSSSNAAANTLNFGSGISSASANAFTSNLGLGLGRLFGGGGGLSGATASANTISIRR